MHYLVLTKLEYPTSVSLQVKGLTEFETKVLSDKFSAENIHFSSNKKGMMEIDSNGITMLNLLSQEFGYRVVGQAMAMELSSLGGRSFQIEKVIWTLEQNMCPYKQFQ